VRIWDPRWLTMCAVITAHIVSHLGIYIIKGIYRINTQRDDFVQIEFIFSLLFC